MRTLDLITVAATKTGGGKKKRSIGIIMTVCLKMGLELTPMYVPWTSQFKNCYCCLLSKDQDM